MSGQGACVIPSLIPKCILLYLVYLRVVFLIVDAYNQRRENIEIYDLKQTGFFGKHDYNGITFLRMLGLIVMSQDLKLVLILLFFLGK